MTQPYDPEEDRTRRTLDALDEMITERIATLAMPEGAGQVGLFIMDQRIRDLTWAQQLVREARRGAQ